jgi:DNA-binding SARP family transcriptional activator
MQGHDRRAALDRAWDLAKPEELPIQRFITRSFSRMVRVPPALGEDEFMAPTIQLLGKPRICDAGGYEQPVRGHQAWAVLARILLSRAPVDRRSLALEVFPETEDPLGSLRWCLASLRRALHSAECLSGDPIESNLPAGTTVDVWRLHEAQFRCEDAGSLLEGIEPRCSAEFSTWLLVERERLAGLTAEKIRQEAIQALSIGEHERAIALAEVGVRRGSLDEGAHVLLVKSLTSAGRYEAALKHVEAVEKLFLAELGQPPSGALRSAARRTIASPPAGVSPEAVVQSLLDSGVAALAAGAVDAGIECLRRAASDAERLTAPHLTAKTLLELGRALVHAVRGHDDEGAILLRQAIETARQRGYADIASSGLREIGYVEALAGRRPGAALYLKEGLDIAQESDGLAGLHAVMGFNLIDWGRIDEGLDQYRLALDHVRRIGNRRREIWTLGLGAWGLMAADRFSEADRWLTRCLELVDDQRWIAFRPWPVAIQAETRLRLAQNPAHLRPALESSFALSCQLGDPCWEAATARSLAILHHAENDLSHAASWLAEARRRCVRETDKYVALLVKIITEQMELSLKQSQGEEAHALARELIAVAARAHMDASVSRAAQVLGSMPDGARRKREQRNRTIPRMSSML